MVTITNFKDFDDKIKRTNCLQAIEKAATTKQLIKMKKLSANQDMIAMLDSFEF